MQREKWEIWYAYVKFLDKPSEGKERPVLVIGGDQYFTISAEVTSHEKRANYPGEVSIKKWKEAGLDKPSTVRLSNVLELSDFSFIRKLGKLKYSDIIAVENEIRNMNI